MLKEKLKLIQRTAFGFNEREIKTLEVNLEKTRHITAFLKNLNNKLNQQQKEVLLKQINSRLDDNLNFFIRFDKNKLLNQEYFITDSGDCFHIKVSIAAFPAKTEKAKEIFQLIFE